MNKLKGNTILFETEEGGAVGDLEDILSFAKKVVHKVDKHIGYHHPDFDYDLRAGDFGNGHECMSLVRIMYKNRDKENRKLNVTGREIVSNPDLVSLVVDAMKQDIYTLEMEQPNVWINRVE